MDRTWDYRFFGGHILGNYLPICHGPIAVFGNRIERSQSKSAALYAKVSDRREEKIVGNKS